MTTTFIPSTHVAAAVRHVEGTGGIDHGASARDDEAAGWPASISGQNKTTKKNDKRIQGTHHFCSRGAVMESDSDTRNPSVHRRFANTLKCKSSLSLSAAAGIDLDPSTSFQNNSGSSGEKSQAQLQTRAVVKKRFLDLLRLIFSCSSSMRPLHSSYAPDNSPPSQERRGSGTKGCTPHR